MNIIAISGHAGSGKDTVASYLCSRYLNTYTESFASPLKRACAEAFGIPLEDFSTPSTKEIDNHLWKVSPRKILQFVGTNMFRNNLSSLLPEGKDFWIRRLSYLINGYISSESGGIYTDDDTIVIPDVRFQNEYEYICSLQSSIVIHLTRAGADGTVGIPGHASELGIFHTVATKTYRISNDSTKEDLYARIEDILSAVKFPNLFYAQTIQR